jgi:hypothetical protein
MLLAPTNTPQIISVQTKIPTIFFIILFSPFH